MKSGIIQSVTPMWWNLTFFCLEGKINSIAQCWALPASDFALYEFPSHSSLLVRERNFPCSAQWILYVTRRLRNSVVGCCCHRNSLFSFSERFHESFGEGKSSKLFPTSRPSCWKPEQKKVLSESDDCGSTQHSAPASPQSSKIGGALSLTWALNRQGWKLVNSCDVFCLIRGRRKKEEDSLNQDPVKVASEQSTDKVPCWSMVV